MNKRETNCLVAGLNIISIIAFYILFLLLAKKYNKESTRNFKNDNI